MLQTIKKQICLQKSDWLLGTGCELGMWLMGIAFMLVMQRSDPEDTYVLLGTIFAIIGSAGVATFIMLYGLGINFNTQISLGNRRTPFLISYYIAWVAGFFVYFGILLLVSQGEHAVYASIWAGTAIKERRCAARFLSYLLSEDGQRCLYLENSYPCVPVLNAVYEQYRRLAGELSAVLDERQPQSCGIG